MAPKNRVNAKKIENFCHQIIQSQLSMTSRLKQGVLNIGKRAGTKILEKGLDIAKFGFNLFSMSKT